MTCEALPHLSFPRLSGSSVSSPQFHHIGHSEIILGGVEGRIRIHQQVFLQSKKFGLNLKKHFLTVEPAQRELLRQKVEGYIPSLISPMLRLFLKSFVAFRIHHDDDLPEWIYLCLSQWNTAMHLRSRR